MEKKAKLKIIQIICLISILVTFFSIQKTYAKYYEKIATTYTTTIKRWVIDVNDHDIHEQESLTSTIMTPVFVHNDHMNDNNTLVPGREGYFPFVINYAKEDLKFRFGFNITQLNNTPLEDFEVYAYEIRDGADTPVIVNVENLSEINPVIDPVETADPVKNATIKYTLDGTEITKNLDSDKEVEIRVLFRWNDANKDTTDANDVSGMNNYEDTTFEGETNTAEDADGLHDVLKYNVKIIFTQVI